MNDTKYSHGTSETEELIDGSFRSVVNYIALLAKSWKLNPLQSTLAIIKIAFDRNNMGILTSCRGHLQLLYFAHTMGRIKHNNFCSRHILEAFQGSFASIT